MPESIYFELLGQARRCRLDDSGLTLLGAGGKELLVYGPAASE